MDLLAAALLGGVQGLTRWPPGSSSGARMTVALLLGVRDDAAAQFVCLLVRPAAMAAGVKAMHYALAPASVVRRMGRGGV